VVHGLLLFGCEQAPLRGQQPESLRQSRRIVTRKSRAWPRVGVYSCARAGLLKDLKQRGKSGTRSQANMSGRVCYLGKARS
jgi:hypothetical protein